MDHREQQFRSLNICHRLYNLMKFLARNAKNMVISGRPLAEASVTKEASTRSSQVVHPMGQGTPPNEDKDKSASNTASASNSEEKIGEVETAIASSASEPKVPKKMVSINENVETISTSDKKRSKKKKNEHELFDESKPLKSILKVSSDVNNTTDDHSLLSRANGA